MLLANVSNTASVWAQKGAFAGSIPTRSYSSQAHSGRRTFAVKMKRLAKEPAVVREILGLASLVAAKEMMEGDPVELLKIVAAMF